MYILLRLDGDLPLWNDSHLVHVNSGILIVQLIINKLAEGGGVFVYMYMYTLSPE